MTPGRSPDRWRIGVVIPARDEAATIAGCIRSVIESFEACPAAQALWVVVVADACTDATAAVARAALAGHGEVIECRAGSPGTARRLGATRVLRHHRCAPTSRLWLANTDADSFVPRDWLALHLEFAMDGATGVAGIVALDAAEPEALADRLFRESYRVNRDGSHAHVHGANLGVRADAYLDVGGWSSLPVAEDHCLWRRLRSAGWPLRSSARSVVTTSSRLRGRAQGGFADTLRARLERHGG